MNERGHFTINKHLLHKLVLQNPTEVLLSVGGRDLFGSAAIAYLESLPAEREYLSDCPQKKADGGCGCFEFGIWTLPATMGAVRLAAQCQFQPAHYDAVERTAKRRGGTEITRTDVSAVLHDIRNHLAAICSQCGRFHSPPACGAE